MAAKAVKVSQLNAYIKRILQSQPVLNDVTVTGEVSNLKFHGSGHVYFTLKDETSKISCFLPKDIAIYMDPDIKEGTEVIVNGYIYLYERGGSYSINIRSIEKAGIGSLAAAFEKLKKKLEEEGLFDKDHKRPLASFPKSIAVVTSDSGDAVQDIIKIVRSRNNYVDIYVCPVLVQGPNAAKDIASMIDEINETMPFLDCIITGRGGGSMEELWAFNEEIVARSIYASEIPVISAVGHEMDYCISDFVADVRAETPTAAAALAVPDLNELRMYLDDISDGLDASIERVLESRELKLLRFDSQAMAMNLEQRINMHEARINEKLNMMDYDMDTKILNYEKRMSDAFTVITELNPENIMKKGYSAVIDTEGKFVTSISQVKKDDNISVRLYDGEINAQVKDIKNYGKDDI